MDGKIKAPPPAGRMWLVGLEIFGVWHHPTCWRFRRNANDFNAPSAIPCDRRRRPRHDRRGTMTSIRAPAASVTATRAPSDQRASSAR